jgi:hypothetical protein
VLDARFTVPYLEHTHFVGRDEDLARLHAALQGEGPVGINPAALGNPTGLTGQGGIGKTQLAVAYAYRYQAHYPDGVYWLNAANDLRVEFADLGKRLLGRGGDVAALKARIWETLRTQFSIEEMRSLSFELDVEHEEFGHDPTRSELAREIANYFERRGQLAALEGAIRRLRGELAQPEAQDELIDHAFDWLREHANSLLILDNLADPAVLDEPLIRNNVPERLPIRLLFTTRRRELGRFRHISLETLPREDALKLLLRGRGETIKPIPADSDQAWADVICNMLGDLPLALEIAAAHLQNLRDVSLADYYAELRNRGALDVMADQRVQVKVRHEAGLAAVLTSQWERLPPEAQLFMRVAGQFWKAIDVPVARLGMLAGIPDKGNSIFDLTYRRVAERLIDLSLIEKLEGDHVRLHPLVHAFAKSQTSRSIESEFREECIRRLLAAFADIEILERQCDSRGIDELIQDLLAAERLFDRAMFDHEIRMELTESLRTYLRVLRREAHNLRGWRQRDTPGFLAQQLHLRLFDSDTPVLFGDLPTSLRAGGPAWLPRWAARSTSPALAMTLTGHAGRVWAVAVTADGRLAVSGGRDRTLRLWNLDTGEAERTLIGHAGRVWTVAVTADGRRAVSGGRDRTLRLWNLDTGEAERTLIGHSGQLRAVAVTADGRRAVSGGDDRTLRLWALDTCREMGRVALDAAVYCVAVAPSTSLIVVAGDQAGNVTCLELVEPE